jgi:flagellar hook-basal body complex protein FliE
MVDALSSVLSATVRAQSKNPAYVGDTQKTATQEATSAPEDFSSMLGKMFVQTSEALAKAEASAIGAVQGKVSVQQAVEAVMSADQSLQAAIAVRDKVTSAYLELSRMTI